MAHARSQGGADSAGNPTLPSGLNSQAPLLGAPLASSGGATPEAKADLAEVGDRSVVLWDEVKPPEVTENKPLGQNLPDDPASH